MFELQLIGRKIKQIRKQQKISQEKLAEMICMNHRSIVRIENAHTVPTLDTLNKLATVFNVKITDFFETDEFKPREVIIENINEHLNNMTDKDLVTFYKAVHNFFN